MSLNLGDPDLKVKVRGYIFVVLPAKTQGDTEMDERKGILVCHAFSNSVTTQHSGFLETLIHIQQFSCRRTITLPPLILITAISTCVNIVVPSV